MRISERCSNGKSFFVDIPADQESKGWLSFLKQVQALVGSVPSQHAEYDGRSYAKVVSSSSPELSEKGRCAEAVIGGETVIEVGNEGVKERLAFLERCLVLRFSSESDLRWPEFRAWANRNWGVPVESTFRYIGDDVWLLVCVSVSEVKRILALKRWQFGEITILMDRWIVAAGRSAVMMDNKSGWVLVRGIPLHIRSKELFKLLGDKCGGFIRAEDVTSLNSIRIKIKLGSEIPEEILIRFGSDIFPLRIELEGVSSISPFGSESDFFRTWKGKGKPRVGGPIGCPPEADLSDPSCSKMSGIDPQFEGGGDRPQDKELQAANSKEDVSVGLMGGNRSLVRVSTGQIMTPSSDYEIETPLDPKGFSAFVGLKLNGKEDLVLMSRVGPLVWEKVLNPDVMLGGSGFDPSRPALYSVCSLSGLDAGL
ncbi:hypothetical protein LINPERHAP1_LOCUS23260 [Linum perenne]